MVRESDHEEEGPGVLKTQLRAESLGGLLTGYDPHGGIEETVLGGCVRSRIEILLV